VPRAQTLVVLLAGGDKHIRGRDIKTALQLAQIARKTGLRRRLHTTTQ